MTEPKWIDLGPIEELKKAPVQQVAIGRTKIALTWNGERFGAIHDACNHIGGPLGKGTLDGDYVVCPWHNWKFHFATGKGEPGYEQDCVPSFELQQRDGRLWVREEPVSARHKTPHEKHPLMREPIREAGPLRVLAISTTAMDPKFPRYSTSEAMLQLALTHAQQAHGAETRMIALRARGLRCAARRHGCCVSSVVCVHRVAFFCESARKQSQFFCNCKRLAHPMQRP
jgi:nitrite reductase/ring-hydroxylating ferredoxin subunit